ncbi:mucosal addressin cell adhesion molecule 1 [Rhynochetos jubatus]
MEPAPLLLLALLWGCSGRPADRLVVTPREPVVQYGGSAQLNCSAGCAGGRVQWKGLDTNLGSVTSFPTHSILHISNATVATAGTKICHGTCQGRHYQRTADLKVYALPASLQLEADPPTLGPGQPTTLRCSAQRVYPFPGARLTWYWGDRALEDTDPDVTETDEELFNIVSTLPVAGEEVAEGTEFRCEVTLSVGQETFTRVASVAVSTGAPVSVMLCKSLSLSPLPRRGEPVGSRSLPLPAFMGWRRRGLTPLGIVCQRGLVPAPSCGEGSDPPAVFTAVTEQPVAVVTSTETPRTAAASTGTPSTAGPVATAALSPEPRVPTRDPSAALSTVPWHPDAETTLEVAAATETPSPEHPAPRDLVTGSPTARPARPQPPGSGTASPPPQGTADSIGQGSPTVAKGTGPPVGTAPTCSLRIWSLPPNGTRGRALRIECRARCSGNATVRWLRTPVPLSQYREEAAGSSSALQLDQAEPRHQGHYQCVLLGHRSPAVSLELRVLEESFSAGPAIAGGTTVSLLGLVVAGVVSCRLWKRFMSQYTLS